MVLVDYRLLYNILPRSDFSVTCQDILSVLLRYLTRMRKNSSLFCFKELEGLLPFTPRTIKLQVLLYFTLCFNAFKYQVKYYYYSVYYQLELQLFPIQHLFCSDKLTL